MSHSSKFIQSLKRSNDENGGKKVKKMSQGYALLSIVLKSLNFTISQLRSKRLCRTPLFLVVGCKVGWPFLIIKWRNWTFFCPNQNVRLRIVRYATASTPDAAFIIGGWDGSTKSDLIARFQNNEWSQYGSLHRRRAGPGSVTFGSQTLIIGGWTDDGR